jgi:flavorubredoxin
MCDELTKRYRSQPNIEQSLNDVVEKICNDTRLCVTEAKEVRMTRIDEVSDGIYRIHTPVPEIPGGFSFNQYLVVVDEPLLWQTGGRRLFPFVRAAIEKVLPVEKLRWVAFSHVESDECGALNNFLAAAPQALPLCSQVAMRVSMTDLADREPRAVSDGETFSIGRRTLTWIDTPQLPHGWDSGLIFEAATRTLFCGDLFTQPGAETPPVTDGDILGPSEAFRAKMDYYSHSTKARSHIERLAMTEPRTLLCMHGSAWCGDGAKLLRALGDALDRSC